MKIILFLSLQQALTPVLLSAIHNNIGYFPSYSLVILLYYMWQVSLPVFAGGFDSFTSPVAGPTKKEEAD